MTVLSSSRECIGFLLTVSILVPTSVLSSYIKLLNRKLTMAKIFFKNFLLFSLSCLCLLEASSCELHNKALDLKALRKEVLDLTDHINDMLVPNTNHLHDDTRPQEQISLQNNLITDTQKEYVERTINSIEEYYEKYKGEKNAAEGSILVDVIPVLSGLDNGIVKVKGGDTNEVLSGVFDIVGCVTNLAKYTGPQGELVETILKNLCGLATSCLVGEIYEGDSDTALMKKALREELGIYRKDEVLSKSRGKIFDAELRLIVLSALFTDVSRGQIDEDTEGKVMKNLGLISTNDFILSKSSGFLEQLWYFIEKAIKHKDEGKDPSDQDKDLAAHALLNYVILSHYRKIELMLLSGLYSAVNAGALGIAAVKILEKRGDQDDERMRQIFHNPDIAFYEFLQRKEHRSKCDVIQRLQPISNFSGTKCTFHYKINNPQTHQDEDYYIKWSSTSERLKFKTFSKRLKTKILSKRDKPEKDDKVWFTLYEKKCEGKRHIGIFSHAAKGFMGPKTDTDTIIERVPENCEDDKKYGWSITTNEKGMSKLSWDKKYFTAISGEKPGELESEIRDPGKNSGPRQSFFKSKL